MRLMLLRGGEFHNALIPFPLPVFLNGRWHMFVVCCNRPPPFPLVRLEPVYVSYVTPWWRVP